MKKIRFLAILSVLFVFFTCKASAAQHLNLNLSYDGIVHKYSAESVSLFVNGNEITNLTMPPVILKSTTLVPAREVFEQLGAKVEWDSDLREVNMRYDEKSVKLKIDDSIADVDGNKLSMNVPPKIINNKTMIPVRFAAEAVGLDVSWDTETRIISVNKNIEQPHDNSNDTETNFDKTSIIYIGLPTETNKSFEINASSKIGKFEHYLLPDGRLVIDIYNSEIKLDKTEYSISSHPFVTMVRAAQNQVTPIMVTRIVFDLENNAKYKIDLTEDRKDILIDFENNIINKIDFSSTEKIDTLTIEGNVAPSVKTFYLTNPTRLVVDMPYSMLKNNENELNTLGNSRFVSEARYSQFDENTVRVALELNSDIDYNVSADGNKTIVSITEPTYRNIHYDRQKNRIALKKDANFKIDINSVGHNDEYLRKLYTISLNGDYSSLFGYGDISVNNEYINSISVQTENNITKFVISEKNIMAYTLTEDDYYIYINVISPKEKYANILVLDAGHGGKDQGASGNGQIEKNLTLDIVSKIIKLAEKDNTIKIYATRTEDTYPSFDDRTNMANEVGDIFISVHINSAGFNTNAKGTEVYHLNPNDTGTGLTSGKLAEKLQAKLLKHLGSYDRGVKTNNYIVLRQSNIPASLCEIGFISNASEAANMSSDSYRMATATAIYESVKELFEQYPTKR